MDENDDRMDPDTSYERARQLSRAPVIRVKIQKSPSATTPGIATTKTKMQSSKSAYAKNIAPRAMMPAAMSEALMDEPEPSNCGGVVGSEM